MYTLSVHSPQPLAKYPWPIHNHSFIGTLWQQLPYSFSFHTNTCTQKTATLNNCEATNKRKVDTQSSGGTPKHCPRTAIQPGLCVCVCVCVGWVWLTLQQNLPSWQQFWYFWKTTEAVCCIGSVPPDNCNLQRYSVWAQFSTLNLPFLLTFLTIVPPVHLTHEDGASEGLWHLFAGTVFISSATSVSLHHIHVW